MKQLLQTDNLIYYCALKDSKLTDISKCIKQNCWYLLTLKPEEIDYLRQVYRR